MIVLCDVDLLAALAILIPNNCYDSRIRQIRIVKSW